MTAANTTLVIGKATGGDSSTTIAGTGIAAAATATVITTTTITIGIKLGRSLW